jgi:hypothetical protein
MAGASPPYVLTTGANGRVHTSLSLTSPAGTVWTVIASSSGVSAVTQDYRIVASEPASVTVALKDSKSGSTTTAASGDAVSGTITVLGSSGKPINDHDMIEVAISPAVGFTADPSGNVALAFSAGSGVKLVPGSHSQYFVRTDAAGQVVFSAVAAQVGTAKVEVTDLSLAQPITAQAQLTITK